MQISRVRSAWVPRWNPLARKRTVRRHQCTSYGQTVRRDGRDAYRRAATRAGDGNVHESHSQSKSETSPRANRLFDEARAGGTTQNKAATGKATQVPSPIPNLISGLTAHAAPLSLAASLAVAAVAAFGRRKSGGKRLVGTGAAVSLVPVATASGEPAWRDASQSPPVPPLDIAGDAFSDFVSGKAVGDVIIRKTDLKSTIDFGKPPTFPASPEQLRTELASLEKDLEAYEALLLSGGKALAKAERSRTGGTKREKTQTHTDGTDSENSQTFKSLVRKQKRKDAPPAPASASKAWWDVDIDQRNYRPAFAVSTQLFSSSTIHKNEKRAKARKEQRLRYFRTNVTVRAASGATAQRAETDLLRRLAPNSPLDARVFDSHEIGATSYGVALAALCKEQNLGDVRGEGTFSDVYVTFPADPVLSRSKPGDWSYVGTTFAADSGPPRFCALRRSEDLQHNGWNDQNSASPTQTQHAVLKCSVPFPGVVNGRHVGDGVGVGATEAFVLSKLPKHENVVELLAAFLSRERNESYLLLTDAGTNLHVMRENGDVSPKDVRWHARETLKALQHCHAHGVVHRDVKGGNVLVGSTKNGTPKTTLIDFGVARHVQLTDKDKASAYGTPGYQAPELLMSDTSSQTNVKSGLTTPMDFETYQKVDVFAFGCTQFFLCVGKELFGPTGGADGDSYGARTKTKARAEAAQDAMDDALESADSRGAEAAGIEIDLVLGDVSSSVEEQMVRRKRVGNKTELEKKTGFARVALRRALGGASGDSVTNKQSQETENELDMRMLRSMAAFPGFEPRTTCEKAFVLATYGEDAPQPAPAHRESLAAFVNRKVTPRQPPGFASLIGACLSRDPENRPTASEALAWPGAWVELDDVSDCGLRNENYDE